MATPHVTGACALLMEAYPDKSYLEIKDAILNTATTTPALLTGKCTSDGRLNLYEAMNYLGPLTPQPMSCRERDSLALVALYNATGADIYWFETWDFSQPMNSWWGVTVNGEGCVTELNLSGNDLYGIIPLKIGNLDDLISLDLSYNQLTGGIPSELGNLDNLTYLNLNDNQLNGNIPSELGNLNNLTILWLTSNEFSGSIPPEFGNLSNLINLDLNHNQLNGNIPLELGNLSTLQVLVLSNNQLSGNIPPELGNLNNLIALYLSNNQI